MMYQGVAKRAIRIAGVSVYFYRSICMYNEAICCGVYVEGLNNWICGYTLIFSFNIQKL